MKSSAKKVELASVDDLFSTEESRLEERLEKIQEIPLSELHPFRNHPFKVKDDEAMMETADSIKQYALFDNYSFLQSNPVSRIMQNMLDTPRRHLLRIVRICAKAQMLIHSAVPPLPHKIIFDAFPGTPLCEIAVLQTAR